MNTIKVKYIDDLRQSLVKLPRGLYSIDGKVHSVDNWNGEEIQTDDYTTIKKLETSTRTISYKNVETDDVIPADEYLKTLESLKIGTLVEDKYDDDESYTFQFASLEHEFEYKKYKRNHVNVNKTITNEIDLVFEVVNMVASTGNIYITPILNFSTGKKDVNEMLYDYDRCSNVYATIREIFRELGYVESKEDISYSLTKDEKIWSAHSSLRYLVAFGTYIYNDKNVPNLRDYRGTLEDCVNQYELDRKNIIDNIKLRHNIHNRVLLDEVSIGKVYFGIEELISKIRKFDYKVKDRDLYYKTIKKAEGIKSSLKQDIVDS